MRMILALVLGFLCWGRPVLAAGQGCPDFQTDGSVSLDLVDGEIVYDFSQSADALRALALSGNSQHAGRIIVRGYTKSEFLYGFEVKVGYMPIAGGMVCAAPDRMTLHIGFRPFQVFVQREYPQGSCQNLAILDHEHNHVRIYRETLARRIPLITSALQSALTNPAYPFQAASSQAARTAIEAHLIGILQQELSFVAADQKRLNDLLDSDESKNATMALCSGW